MRATVLLTNPTLILLEIVFRTARMAVVEYTNQSKYSQTAKFFGIKWVAKVKFQKIGKNGKILKVHTQVKLTNNLHQNLSNIRQCCRLGDSKTILLTRLLFHRPCGKLASAFLYNTFLFVKIYQQYQKSISKNALVINLVKVSSRGNITLSHPPVDQETSTTVTNKNQRKKIRHM